MALSLNLRICPFALGKGFPLQTEWVFPFPTELVFHFPAHQQYIDHLCYHSAVAPSQNISLDSVILIQASVNLNTEKMVLMCSTSHSIRRKEWTGSNLQ